MTHIPIEGGSIDSHPLISRFMKGIFELSPPTPRYLQTSDVFIGLKFLKTLSPKESISFKLLSYKVLMLCAPTSFNRADTLHKLELSFRIFKPDRVLFKPCSVSKTARPSKPLKDLFFPSSAQDRRLCITTYLKYYEEKTKQKRHSDGSQSSFFFHQCSSQARWIIYFM